jgi:hypothetical protein
MKMALVILEHTGKSICHYGICPTFKQSKLTRDYFARSTKVKNPEAKGSLCNQCLFRSECGPTSSCSYMNEAAER